jgi:hypothetical protein
MKHSESVKEIDDQRKEKLIKRTENEQELLENMKGKKAPKEVVEKIIDRLYQDAERRKLARECRLEEIEKVKGNDDDTPTKYKKKLEQNNEMNVLLYNLET